MNFSGNKLRLAVEAAKHGGRDGKAIAAEGGFSAGSLSVWMNKGVVPSAEQLAVLSRVLRKPMEYFFEGNEAVSTYALQEAPAEPFIDDLLAEFEDFIEHARNMEKLVKSLRGEAGKPPSKADLRRAFGDYKIKRGKAVSSKAKSDAEKIALEVGENLKKPSA